MKVLWALVKVLDDIYGQLVRLNLNIEKTQPDTTKQFGEKDTNYWKRLKGIEIKENRK